MTASRWPVPGGQCNPVPGPGTGWVLPDRRQGALGSDIPARREAFRGEDTRQAADGRPCHRQRSGLTRRHTAAESLSPTRCESADPFPLRLRNAAGSGTQPAPDPFSSRLKCKSPGQGRAGVAPPCHRYPPQPFSRHVHPHSILCPSDWTAHGASRSNRSANYRRWHKRSSHLFLSRLRSGAAARHGVPPDWKRHISFHSTGSGGQCRLSAQAPSDY